MKHVFDKIPKRTKKAKSIAITNCQNNTNKPTKLEQAIAMSLIFLIPLLCIGRNTKYGRIISSKIFGNKNSFQTFGSNVTFNDVKGCDEAKYELEQTVEFLKNPWKFSKFGGRLSKGVLLHGPPGTGKHLFLKIVFLVNGILFQKLS